MGNGYLVATRVGHVAEHAKEVQQFAILEDSGDQGVWSNLATKPGEESIAKAFVLYEQILGVINQSETIQQKNMLTIAITKCVALVIIVPKFAFGVAGKYLR